MYTNRMSTEFMGQQLKNPIIAGAGPFTATRDSLLRLEDAGVAAVVTASLFEEEIQLERFRFDEDQEKFNYRHPEMITVFPEAEHGGPREHLHRIREAKEALSIPVFASLNAVNDDTWVEYAALLEETGVDGLELNFFSLPSTFEKDGNALERERLAQLDAVLKTVKIPVMVKLSYCYTNPLDFISLVSRAGAAAVVVFNRFFQPDIDIDNEENTFPLNWSRREDMRLPLKYAGLLYGNIDAAICASTGIYHGEDVVKMILAGADTVQVVTTLYRHGPLHLSTMLAEIKTFMMEKGYASLDGFRGKLSRKHTKDPWRYTRDQYVKQLLMPGALLHNNEVV